MSFTKFIPEFLLNTYVYRNLLLQLIKRDISARYQGAVLGLLWSFLFPLLTLAVYAVVFGYILSPRWPNISDTTQFTVILFSGLLLFNFFSECVSRAPLLIVANANYVKKVVFPVDLLIWIPIGTALFHLFFGLLAWTLLVLSTGGALHQTFLLFVFILFPFILSIAGICWLLAALGVFVRDIGQVVGVSMQLFLYLGPVIYPREILPFRYQLLMSLNPITIPVEFFRDVLYFGYMPNLGHFFEYLFVSILICWLGGRFFEKTRRGFADVI